MTSIEWTDKTWNCVVGCTRVSSGCDHCYAMGVAHRAMSFQHVGLTKLRPKDASRPGIDWTGEVRFLPERLAEPMRWRKPRRVFVNSMSDLFHERVTDEQIEAVFGVMAACPQHTFQVLTKRPGRALRFFLRDVDWPTAIGEAASIAAGEGGFTSLCYMPEGSRWPLPNVHLGVSVEDQTTADERIPLLLECPAAVHWVSAEPLLGPVRMDWAFWRHELHDKPAIRWLVIGGESGPGARPFDLAWARDLISFAAGSDCAVFVKQLGRWPYESVRVAERVEADLLVSMARATTHPPPPGWTKIVDRGTGEVTHHRYVGQLLADRKGGDMAEWRAHGLADLSVREFPEVRC